MEIEFPGVTVNELSERKPPAPPPPPPPKFPRLVPPLPPPPTTRSCTELTPVGTVQFVKQLRDSLVVTNFK